jgi:hypothetical protein
MTGTTPSFSNSLRASGPRRRSEEKIDKSNDDKTPESIMTVNACDPCNFHYYDIRNSCLAARVDMYVNI